MLFDDEIRRRINEAVRQAESATAAEIIPVVARCSGRYDRGEDILGLWTAGLAMLLAWWVYPLPDAEPGSWGGIHPAWQIVVLLVAGLLGFLIGALLGARIDWARRLFTPAAQMREEVERRAREVFFDQRVHHTRSGAGLLLYVSLFERRAAVIADRTLLERFGQPQLDQLCSELTQSLRELNVADGLCDTVRLAGERLSVAVPRQADDENELADALVVLD